MEHRAHTKPPNELPEDLPANVGGVARQVSVRVEVGGEVLSVHVAPAAGIGGVPEVGVLKRAVIVPRLI